jgi:hypothetical protein
MSKKRSSTEAVSFDLSNVKGFASTDPVEEIAAYYKKYQVVLIKSCVAKQTFGVEQIRKLHTDASTMIDKTFSVEALKGQRGWCTHSSADLFGGDDSPAGEWYSSFIAQTKKGTNSAIQTFRDSLPLTSLPWIEKAVSSEVKYTKPVWVFAGRNGSSSELSQLRGRPEHIDSVDHDGTWHVQSAGTKVWYIRPAETVEWGETCLTVNDSSEGQQSKKQKTLEIKEFADGLPRLKVVVEEGDVLILNTRVWWHQTRIPPTGKKGFSISYAIDFYCQDLQLSGRAKIQPAQSTDSRYQPSADAAQDEEESDEDAQEYSNKDGLYASKPLKAGEVVFYEAELPDCALPRSEDPNCEIVWLKDGSGALCAVKDLQAGDWLTVAPSDSESESGDEDGEGWEDHEGEDSESEGEDGECGEEDEGDCEEGEEGEESGSDEEGDSGSGGEGSEEGDSEEEGEDE